MRVDGEEAAKLGLETEVQYLEQQLTTRRIVLEHELASSGDKVFVKVHVPDRVLMAEAERAGMRLPLNSKRLEELRVEEEERAKTLSRKLAASTRQRRSTIFQLPGLGKEGNYLLA